MNLIKTVEDLAETIGTDVETFADTEYHAFLTASLPLFNDLKAFAQTTGKADLATLLNDLKADLVTGVTTLAATGGNTGAAIAAVSTEALGQVKDVTAAAKNAVYGALAIVAADVPAIVGAPAASSASGASA
ncbi:MAG TPA: hypothetical protein VHW09_26730 [Bryobacteraceae bacterium]|jgi:hypothetical protein|nr:hypothetical protein [Bryobacteraceae bacterium]